MTLQDSVAHLWPARYYQNWSDHLCDLTQEGHRVTVLAPRTHRRVLRPGSQLEGWGRVGGARPHCVLEAAARPALAAYGTGHDGADQRRDHAGHADHDGDPETEHHGSKLVDVALQLGPEASDIALQLRP